MSQKSILCFTKKEKQYGRRTQKVICKIVLNEKTKRSNIKYEEKYNYEKTEDKCVKVLGSYLYTTYFPFNALSSLDYHYDYDYYDYYYSIVLYKHISSNYVYE